MSAVVEDLVKEYEGKEVKGGLQERCKEEEGVEVGVLTKGKVVEAKLQELRMCKGF
ncbi:hypothetical protein PPACK8108_LOCUS4968 [Phakopsora pachyrhizi]|uniref:Uncharacterized protein n=1 Tax=Phakopsora pachyrhizi TaxID=170000 RepID=A0AAV0AR84_PHAPC|nr:hypothetical protein PPACK8108_LOCUS4968 [Phakopsora pachyrhizi]